MSGDMQERSPAQQREAIEQWALANGRVIVAWYQDLAISGDTDTRPGFDAMSAAAVSGKWKEVLVWDESRFGRWDELDLGHYVFPFRRAKVKLVSVKDNKVIDFDDATDRLVLLITQVGRNKENKDRAAHSARGKKEMAELGNWQGINPWAYRVVVASVSPKERKGTRWRTLEPVEGLERWCRWAFNAWAREGLSVYAIVRHLTANGVPGPKGGAWSPNTLRGILKNPAYLGHTHYCQRTRAKYWKLTSGGVKAPTADAPTGRNRRGSRPPKTNDRSDVIIREDTHLPLVDLETWTLAQQRTAEEHARNSRPGAGKARATVLFTGLCWCPCGMKLHARLVWPSRHVRCPKCRHVMTRSPRPDSPPLHCVKCKTLCPVTPGTPYLVYLCTGWRQKGTCQSRRVQEADLKRAVVDQVLGGILNRPGLREEVERRVMAQVASGPDEAKALRRQADDLEAKVKLASERFLVCPPEATASAAEAIRRWKGELDVAKDRLANLAEAATSAKDAKRILRETLEAVEALRGTLRVAAPPGKADAKRRMLAALYRRLITRVDVDFEANKPTAVRVTLNRTAFELRNLLTHLEPIVASLREDIAEDIAFQAEMAGRAPAPKRRDTSVARTAIGLPTLTFRVIPGKVGIPPRAAGGGTLAHRTGSTP
jgi:site-specific DNA recombinase